MEIKEKYKQLYNECRKYQEIQLSTHPHSGTIEKSCNTCVNMSCRVPNYEKNGVDEYGRPYGENCLGYQKRKNFN